MDLAALGCGWDGAGMGLNVLERAGQGSAAMGQAAVSRDRATCTGLCISCQIVQEEHEVTRHN